MSYFLVKVIVLELNLGPPTLKIALTIQSCSVICAYIFGSDSSECTGQSELLIRSNLVM